MGRGVADELIAEMQRVFDEHEARMVKLMLAQSGFFVAVVGVAVIIVAVVDR